MKMIKLDALPETTIAREPVVLDRVALTDL